MRLRRRRVAAVLASATLALVGAPLPGRGQELPYASEFPAVRYATRTPSTPVERLRQRLARGDVTLAHDPAHGRLAALLEALDVPVSSQILVFSGTSLQEGLIGPRTPRAIYFNDETYVAWVQGGEELEIAAMDPALGPVFYTLEQRATEAGPTLRRHDALCLECHDTYGLTGGGVPRFLIGSGPTDERGRSAAHGAWRLTTHATPLERRWGGWYVTGTHGAQRHMGNVVVPVTGTVTAEALRAGGNVTELSSLIDADPYLGRHSDIVALLVAEHQMHVQNLLTRVSWETRGLDSEAPGIAERVAEVTEPLVRAVLFADEAPLSAPVRGTSTFRAEFEARGARDGRGRSLRDLDLERRLQRHPLSFQVRSGAFASLPTVAREYLARRVLEVLRSDESPDGFGHLSAADRRAILEIVQETGPAFLLPGS